MDLQVGKAIVIALSLTSGLSVAVFALFALFNNYKDKDGNVTRAGKQSIIGIVIAAVCTIGSSILNTYIDARKAAAQQDADHKQATEQEKRFNKQNAALGDLARGLAISLRREQAALAAQKRSYAALQGVSEQQHTSTKALLMNAWENVNRVQDSGVSVMLGLTCNWKGDDVSDVERIFPANSSVELVIESKRRLEAHLVSTSESYQSVNLAEAGIFQQAYTFTPVAGDYHEFRNLQKWKGMRLAARISGANPGIMERVLPRVTAEVGGLAPPSAYPHDTPGEDGDHRFLPCSASFSVAVAGVEVANGDAVVAERVSFPRTVDAYSEYMPVQVDKLPRPPQL